VCECVSVFKSIFVPSCKIAIKWPRLRVIDKRLYAKQFTYECVQAKKHVCAGGGEGEGGGSCACVCVYVCVCVRVCVVLAQTYTLIY